VLRALRRCPPGKRIAFVGLPCQIAGVRKAQATNRRLRDVIGPCIGIFCARQFEFGGTKIVLRRFGRARGRVTRLRYRSGGWPGGIRYRAASGEESFIGHRAYYPAMFGPFFFTPLRCLTCTDQTAELADLSCGDAWLPEVMATDDIGSSVILTRSEEGEAALAAAGAAVVVEPLSPAEVGESQSFVAVKKNGTVGRMRLLRRLRRSVPSRGPLPPRSRRNMVAALVVLACARMTRFWAGRLLVRYAPVSLLHRFGRFVYRCAAR